MLLTLKMEERVRHVKLEKARKQMLPGASGRQPCGPFQTLSARTADGYICGHLLGRPKELVHTRLFFLETGRSNRVSPGSSRRESLGRIFASWSGPVPPCPLHSVPSPSCPLRSLRGDRRLGRPRNKPDPLPKAVNCQQPGASGRAWSRIPRPPVPATCRLCLRHGLRWVPAGSATLDGARVLPGLSPRCIYDSRSVHGPGSPKPRRHLCPAWGTGLLPTSPRA